MNRDVTVGDQKKTLQNKKHLKILAGFMVFIIALYVVLFLFFRDAPTEVELTLEQRPSTDFKIVDTLNVGDSVTVGEIIDNWYPLTKGGFIHKSLVN